MYRFVVEIEEDIDVEDVLDNIEEALEASGVETYTLVETLVDIGNSWQGFFDSETEKEYYQNLRRFL